jgi:hypothetical protein
VAKMMPPYVSDEVKSRGECQIFEFFQNDPATSDWVVLHSLGLSQHTKRLYGEIDFVVLAPGLGVFCLEVKSGEVQRTQGVWQFTNKYGQTNRKPYGPFDQAQDNMFSLMKAIQKHFGANSHLNRLMYGYGVMFPHILFSAEGLEQEPWKIYDRASRRRPISDYIKQLARNKRMKVRQKAWFDPIRSLPTKSDVDRLADFLRGDFERLISPRERLGDIEEQIHQFTTEQYHCLDQLTDNPRCLFRGAAGTGKTMIALESTRRRLFAHQRVLLACYNTLLGDWLAAQFPSTEEVDNLVVGSFHRLLTKISSTSIAMSARPADDDYFKYELPLMALDAVDNGEIEPFDHLIVDEGQDLIRPEYLDVFDSLLKGGLAGGNWEMYCDFEKQAIYAELTAAEILHLLEERANFTQFRLTINCRNTRPIGKQTALLCGFEISPFLPAKIEGLPVDYHFYRDKAEAVDKLSDLLLKFRSQKIPARQISILSPYKFQNSVVAKLDRGAFQIHDLTENRDTATARSRTTFSTIHSFKGLENTYIILTDIGRLDDDEFRSLLYVGMSRARAGLSVFIHEQARKVYNKLLEKSIGE